MRQKVKLAKILESGHILVRECDPEKEKALAAELRESGFLDFVASEKPTCGDGQKPAQKLEVIDGRIVQRWETAVDTSQITEKIDVLKRKLADTDYTVVKCMECFLAGEAVPYDITALRMERQGWRDEITALRESLCGDED